MVHRTTARVNPIIGHLVLGQRSRKKQRAKPIILYFFTQRPRLPLLFSFSLFFSFLFFNLFFSDSPPTTPPLLKPCTFPSVTPAPTFCCLDHSDQRYCTCLPFSASPFSLNPPTRASFPPFFFPEQNTTITIISHSTRTLNSSNPDLTHRVDTSHTFLKINACPAVSQAQHV